MDRRVTASPGKKHGKTDLTERVYVEHPWRDAYRDCPSAEVTDISIEEAELLREELATAIAIARSAAAPRLAAEAAARSAAMESVLDGVFGVRGES